MYKVKLYCYPILDNNTYSETNKTYEILADYNNLEGTICVFLNSLIECEELDKMYKIHIDVFNYNTGILHKDLNYIVYLDKKGCTIIDDFGKFRDIKAGDIVRHFKYEYLKLSDRKKNVFTYKVLGNAIHTETNEKMIIYQALYEPFETYTRPYDMFMGEADSEKYPNTNQVFRFYKVNL